MVQLEGLGKLQKNSMTSGLNPAPKSQNPGEPG
jgi:hypothetical protein